jgi:hypothetical protein
MAAARHLRMTQVIAGFGDNCGRSLCIGRRISQPIAKGMDVSYCEIRAWAAWAAVAFNGTARLRRPVEPKPAVPGIAGAAPPPGVSP